jgi:N-acetylmuramoyl-L-alanine amidase
VAYQFLRKTFSAACTLFFLLMPVCTASSPAVVRVDDTVTVLLLSREIYIEIVASPKRSRNTAMDQFVQTSMHNNRRFLIRQGFRSSSNVYRMPWKHLTCKGKQLAIEHLFPKDSLKDDGWEHFVTYSGAHGETLWRISDWFTGSGTHANKLAQLNRTNPQRLGIGTKILIPDDMLISCFRTVYDYPIVVNDLTYNMDSEGVYAEYTLLAGQAIYSLVLRYTPRVTASDVMSASRTILDRSGLKDFHAIPVNTVLKIPADLISPQFLPPNDPRRLQFEATARESSQYRPDQVAKALKGVTVILDAGHGGVDPGAIGIGGIQEKEYAYDVMCRVKRILEKETRATVYVTIEDEETGFVPRQERLLNPGNNREKILTNPPFFISDSRIALNLRWLLVNSYFLSHSASNRNERVVFTSFHVDSLHPSVEGLMVYLPGADYYTGSTRLSASVYMRRKEAQGGRHAVSTTRKERLRAEGYSKSFADQIIAQCLESVIPLHPNQPVRRFIVRRRRSWVPALLRYSRVPARVLIELANLQNPDDVERIMDPDYRESLARMYVSALKAHFSEL